MRGLGDDGNLLLTRAVSDKQVLVGVHVVLVSLVVKGGDELVLNLTGGGHLLLGNKLHGTGSEALRDKTKLKSISKAAMEQ